MDTTLLDNQKVTGTVSYLDSAGNPATLPAGVVPVWASDNTSFVTVDASGDPSGLTAVVTAVGPLGSANVTATATMPDNSTIVATSLVTVSGGGTAATAVITFGTPSNK